MRIVLLVLALLLAPLPLVAQTVMLYTDLAQLPVNVGSDVTVDPVDDNGDGVADAFLVHGKLYATNDVIEVPPQRYVFILASLVRVAATGPVPGPVFDPVARANAFLVGRGLPPMSRTTATVRLVKNGRRDVFQVQDGTIVVQVRLDR